MHTIALLSAVLLTLILVWFNVRPLGTHIAQENQYVGKSLWPLLFRLGIPTYWRKGLFVMEPYTGGSEKKVEQLPHCDASGPYLTLKFRRIGGILYVYLHRDQRGRWTCFHSFWWHSPLVKEPAEPPMMSLETANEAIASAEHVQVLAEALLQKVICHGSESLADKELLVWSILVEWLTEILSGGFESYFCSGCADAAKLTLRSLQTAGLTDASQIFQKACAEFGPEGPSENCDVRFNQIQRLDDESFQLWAELSEGIDAMSDQIEVACWKWWLNN